MKHNRPQPEAQAESANASTGGSEGAERAADKRQAYREPQLRRLGSVRELTLGATGFLADGGTTRRRNM